MGKLVVLRLGEGDFEQGFPVNLAIGEDGDRPFTEVSGKLPSAPDLVTTYQRWQEAYWNLGLIARLGAPSQQVTNVSIINPLEHCHSVAEQLKVHLKTWYSSEQGSFNCIREKLFQELDKSDDIRLLIQTDDPQLRRIPWQLFFEPFLDSYPKAELALSPQNYGHLEVSDASREKVRILAILGSSLGLNLEEDRKQLAKLTGSEVHFLAEPPRRKLNDHLWEQGWDILFFAGHSSSQIETGKGRIQINATDCLSLDQIKYALRKAIRHGLKLAIFNSCDGLELARSLVDLHLPQIIVMREPVPDIVAQEFLKQFLVAFSRGESLYLSVREAREKLQPLEKDFPCATWLPVICQHPAFIPLTWQTLQPPKLESIFKPAPKPHQPEVTPDELVLVKRIGSTTLRIQYCDITKLTADAIVSSDDVELTMGGGVSEAILLAGGEAVWEEAQRRSPLKLGEIAITTAGNLSAKQIFHAAVVDHNRKSLTTVDLIRSLTRKCLEMANAQGFQTIAFPALATGSARLSPEQSAIAMMLEIIPHLTHETSLHRVTIALYGREGLDHTTLVRFYAQISDLLDAYYRMDIMKTLLNDLEKVYRGQKMEAAAEIAATYREQLDALQEQWATEILRQPASVEDDKEAQQAFQMKRLLMLMQNLQNHPPTSFSNLRLPVEAIMRLLQVVRG